MNDERDKVEKKSYVKQVLTMNGYPEWLINSIPTIQPSPESTTSGSSDDTSDDVRETELETTNNKPTSKKSPVVLPYIPGVSEHIRRVFEKYKVPAYFKHMNTLVRQLFVRQKDKILKERVVGPVYHIPYRSYDASYIDEPER